MSLGGATMKIRLRNTGLDAELCDRESHDTIRPSPKPKYGIPT